MNIRILLATLLIASLAGNASFLFTVFLKKPSLHQGAIEKLLLTAEQSQKFEEAKRLFQDERMKSRRKMSNFRGMLADEFLKDKPDRQTLIHIAEEMVQVQTHMRPKLIDHLLTLHTIITPLQRKAMADFMRTGAGGAATCPGAILYSNPQE